jgi:hypothetical protein
MGPMAEQTAAGLAARIEAALAEIASSGQEDIDALVAEARRLDAQLADLHQTLATTRAARGYALAQEIAVARDALCARIGLWFARTHEPSADPMVPVVVAPAADDDEAPAQIEPIEQVEAPPASAEEIASFVERASKTGLGSGARLTDSTPEWPTLLDVLVAQVGPPPEEEADVDAEVEALHASTGEADMASWIRLPGDVQRAWVSMLVARVSRMRDSGTLSAAQVERMREVVTHIQTHTRAHRTGHVNGLALRHRPVAPTWGEDALRYWNELVALLDAPGHAETAPRRRAARAIADSEERVSIPETWPHRALFKNKTVVLIGGEPREVSRVRLERALAVKQLEWISSRNPRRHDALVHAIAGGGIDLVFVVKNLMAHSIQEKIVAACEEHDIGWALVDGYGVAAFMRGVERFLARRSVA